MTSSNGAWDEYLPSTWLLAEQLKSTLPLSFSQLSTFPEAHPKSMFIVVNQSYG